MQSFTCNSFENWSVDLSDDLLFSLRSAFGHDNVKLCLGVRQTSEIDALVKFDPRDLSIICDASHIAGKATLIEDIAQTAMDINLDGLMIETHNNPSLALSDAEQQITPESLKNIMQNLVLRDTKLRDEQFKANGCDFWTPWAMEGGNLGPIYGTQWNAHGQLDHVLNSLR